MTLIQLLLHTVLQSEYRLYLLLHNCIIMFHNPFTETGRDL